jgi:hypothetical protein
MKRDEELISKITSKKLFLIAGASGTGKTIFIRNLKRMMNGQETVRVYDDMSYILESNSARKRDMQGFMDKVRVLRHTDEKIIMTMHDISRLHTPVRNLLHDPFVLKNTAIILTSLTAEQYTDYRHGGHRLKWFKPVGDSLLRNFHDEYVHFCMSGTTKTTRHADGGVSMFIMPKIDERPFLLMTDEGHDIGYFDMVHENWSIDVEALINPGWIGELE